MMLESGGLSPSRGMQGSDGQQAFHLQGRPLISGPLHHLKTKLQCSPGGKIQEVSQRDQKGHISHICKPGTGCWVFSGQLVAV